jgi:MFS family permease
MGGKGVGGGQGTTGPSRAAQNALLISVLLFSTALGVTAVAFPLRAWEVGYGPAAVGYLGGVTAAHQVVTRLCLPWLLRRVPDRWLILAAGALLAGSGAVLLMSTTLVSFVVAAALLGLARALFWTASQVHVLHGELAAGQRTLSYLQFLSSLGELIGPAVGGVLIQHSSQAALWFWVGCAAASIVPAALLPRFAPLARTDRRQTTPIWRRRDVVFGCAAAASTGGWRALLSSLVPVVLAELGQPAGQIGILVAVANGASVVGALLAGRVPQRWWPVAAVTAMAAAGIGIGAVGLCAGSVLLAGTVLALSGFGGGVLQTLGPVLAAGAVAPEQRGDAVVLIGLARSVALLALPTGVGALVGVLATPLALAVGGAVLMVPVVAYGRWRR